MAVVGVGATGAAADAREGSEVEASKGALGSCGLLGFCVIGLHKFVTLVLH